jgi:hypothetical protein
VFVWPWYRGDSFSLKNLPIRKPDGLDVDLKAVGLMEGLSNLTKAVMLLPTINQLDYTE